MLKQARSDKALQTQALARAREIIGQYVRNVGLALGKEYEVAWE